MPDLVVGPIYPAKCKKSNCNEFDDAGHLINSFLFLNRFRIIDTDSFSAESSHTEKSVKKKKSNEIVNLDDDPDERYATAEEKPQVAGIVDERPAQVFHCH